MNEWMKENATFSYECMNTCILDHLNREGIRISGSDIFYSGCGYPVHYKKGSLTEVKTEGYDANFRFLKKYNIEYWFGKMNPSKETLLDLLQKPYTITIRMISDFLTCDTVQLQTSRAFHFINILDYDRQRRKFYIVDGEVSSEKDGCFSKWVNEDNIVKGWQLMKGEILQMDFFSIPSKMELTRRIKRDAIRGMKQGVESYLNGKHHLFSREVLGERGVVTMLQQLGRHVGRDEFEELTREATFRLRVDGFMGAKKFLLEKIREQGKAVIAKEYEETIDEWLCWCGLLQKSGLISSKKNFATVKMRMNQLILQERDVLEKLLVG